MTPRETGTRTAIEIPIGEDWLTGEPRVLTGELCVPAAATGVVMFAYASEISRHSPRNQYVARAMERRALATLVIDLLTSKEQGVDREAARFRFDIPLLAERLVGLVDWLRGRTEVTNLPMGLFGDGTDGSAALVAAAARPADVAAVVSRGGRPDLAGPALTEVTAPTLLLVGGRDIVVARINREALVWMPGVVALEIIAGATHLFGEPGALEQVAALSADWFTRHLHPADARAAG